MVQAVEGSASSSFSSSPPSTPASLSGASATPTSHGIHDALPMRESTDWLSKLPPSPSSNSSCSPSSCSAASSCRPSPATTTTNCSSTSRSSTSHLSPVLIFTLLAFFLQTVLGNKFIAHGDRHRHLRSQIRPLPLRLGEHALSLRQHSALHLLGHERLRPFRPRAFLVHHLLAAISALLGVLSIAFALRGSDDTWHARAAPRPPAAPRLIPAASSLPAHRHRQRRWYFYNAHVLNEFLNTKPQRDIQASYERDFKKYERLPQPKIIAVDADIDIFPQRRSFSGTGHFVLQNKTPQPIPQIHITDQRQSVTNVQFDRPFHLVSKAPRDLYTIYALDHRSRPATRST